MTHINFILASYDASTSTLLSLTETEGLTKEDKNFLNALRVDLAVARDTGGNANLIEASANVSQSLEAAMEFYGPGATLFDHAPRQFFSIGKEVVNTLYHVQRKLESGDVYC